MKLVSVVASFFIVSAAAAHVAITDEPDPNARQIEVRETPKDFKIPTPLWDLILDKDHKKDGDDTLIVWLPVKVFLTAKRPNILIEEKIQYNLPRGGGSIDQSKHTLGDRGTFYVKFGLDEFSNPQAMKIFFISNSKKRRLEGDIYGAGCNVYFDITGGFLQAQKLDGLKYNITDNRHVSALSGHFIFAQIEKDKVYLSQVEFIDTKNRDYLCKIKILQKFW